MLGRWDKEVYVEYHEVVQEFLGCRMYIALCLSRPYLASQIVAVTAFDIPIFVPKLISSNVLVVSLL